MAQIEKENEKKDVKTEGRNQLVVFQLGKEEYAVDITQSKEIIKIDKITNVPNTPDYVRGVINLRGQIIPVVDLRKRFNISDQCQREKVITVEVNDTLIGLVVDAVNEVFWFDLEELAPAPEVDGGIKQEFIKGVIQRGERLLVLIDLKKLLFESKRAEEGRVI